MLETNLGVVNMGLNSFETEGPLTYSSDEQKQTKQDTFGSRVVGDFEDEWGMPQHEAETNLEFIAERVEETESISELCDVFDWLEHTVISKVAEAVEEGIIKKADVPSLTHPAYNEKETSFYIDQRINNEDLGSSHYSSTSSTTSTKTTTSTDDSEDFNSGLGNFTS